MAYITQRSNTFYVVDYRGRDPISGSERRKWHHCGPHRADAERLLDELNVRPTTTRARGTLETFMTGPWLATKHTLTTATRTRYRWMIDHNISPRLGHVRLDALRPDDLDTFYTDLIATGGRRRQGLSPKTVLEIHRVISNALDLATDRHLIAANPARHARPPKPGRCSTTAQVWSADQLASERLGHAHPGFTMHTCQHVLPGMGASAANQFAELVAAAGRWTSTDPTPGNSTVQLR